MALEKETGKRVETDLITWRGMMTKVYPCLDIVQGLEVVWWLMSEGFADHGCDLQ